MRVDIITLFPPMFENVLGLSILKRASEKGLVEYHLHNLRDWSTDKYGSVDDHPYGGGVGMVLRVDIVAPAIAHVKKENPGAPVILMTPQGAHYKQAKALELAKLSGLILIAGHYEGYDERIREYVDQEISIGDYVLTGGELPAMTVIDSVVRLLPGVLGDDLSSVSESFSENLLEYPQYTRPMEYESKNVPEILLGGNHKLIEEWRQSQAIAKTKQRRPDLLHTPVAE
ncbi:MAG: tRNA (guanosine(37)-N1)-methyltransferase TrmD [bacterium]